MENVYYLPAIRETAPSSSEAVRTVAAASTIAPNEPAKESEPSRAAEIGEGQSLKAPPRATESTAEA